MSDIILLTMCGVLSGFDTWEGLCDFGESRTDFLRSLGYFEDGIPSSDTIARVRGMVSPSAMQKAFINWMKDCHQISDGEVIAINGKPFAALTINQRTLCNSYGERLCSGARSLSWAIKGG